jgi:hypothetical protein
MEQRLIFVAYRYFNKFLVAHAPLPSLTFVHLMRQQR